MRFAYLIIAHNNYELLNKLLSVLDDENNDIYIHFDARIKNINDKEIVNNVSHSSVQIVNERVKVSWGGVGLVQATFALLNAAKRSGTYDYYHLMSGVDFPIKSNKYLQQFFEHNSGKEFVSFDPYYTKRILQNRVSYYHLIDGNQMRKSKTMYKINQILVGIQRILHITRKPIARNLCGGSNWFSITDNLASALLEDKTKILDALKYTFCSDEIFVQTFIQNNVYFSDRVYRKEKYGNMRYIVFDSFGACQTWKYDQYEELMNSPYLYARKFSEDDVTLVDKIIEKISNK